MIPFLSPFILSLLGGRFKWLADLLAIGTLIIAAWGAWNLWLHFHDSNVIEKHDNKITAETMKTDFEAKLEAADQRAKDQATISANQEERNDEIRKAPDSKPSAARNALNCDRMRRQGKDTSGIAACR